MFKFILTLFIAFNTSLAMADNKAIVIDEMAGYLDFVDYGGGVIFAEQIPEEEYKKDVHH